MGEVNILQLMSRFDFSEPFSVTIIMDEKIDELPDRNFPKKQDQSQNYNCILKENIRKRNQGQQQIKNTPCNKTSPSKQLNGLATIAQSVIIIEDELLNREHDTQMTNSNSKIAEPSQNANEKNTCNQHSANALTENTIADVSKIYSSTNDRKGWSMYVINLLHRVSADLILVMRPYYHDSCRNHKQLKKLKDHIYSLSYSTIESIILPQENNKIFVEKFIDMIVANANNVFGWKCERKHVKPFYDEMISWSKQKRKQMKKSEVSKVLNNNCQNNKIIKNNTKSNISIKNPKVNEGIIQNPRKSEDISCSKNGTRKNSTVENGRTENILNKEKMINSNHRNLSYTHSSKINQDELSGSQINADVIATLNDRQSDEIIMIRENIINNNLTKENRTADTGITENVINDNRILMEHLVTPQRPVNFSHSSVAPIPTLNLNTENSTCIFSYGAPGHQVTINISQDTLLNHMPEQNCNQIEPNVCEINGINVMSSNLPQHYLTNNNKHLNHPPQPSQQPPSISTDASQTQITLTTVPQNFTYIQNHWQRTSSENIQIDQTLRHPAPAIEMHYPPAQEQSTVSPKNAINNSLPSINYSSELVLTGPCHTCGKITKVKCSKCYKVSYCSKQCQWLDTEVHKALKSQLPTRINI